MHLFEGMLKMPHDAQETTFGSWAAEFIAAFCGKA